MRAIQNGKLQNINWTFAEAPPSQPPSTGQIITLKQWQEHQDQWSARDFPLAIKLTSDQSPFDIKGDLTCFDMVIFEFKLFTDGRGFSYGRVLKENLNYKGNICAMGNLLKDQYHFLDRCGFDTIIISENVDENAWIEANNEFDVWYQKTNDGRKTIAQRRHCKQK